MPCSRVQHQSAKPQLLNVRKGKLKRKENVCTAATHFRLFGLVWFGLVWRMSIHNKKLGGNRYDDGIHLVLLDDVRAVCRVNTKQIGNQTVTFRRVLFTITHNGRSYGQVTHSL